MTDLPRDDGRFEQQLRAVLADLAPETAPASLRAAVAVVPARRVRHAPDRGRGLIAVLGLAAAVVVAVAGIALLTGPPSDRPAGVGPTGGVPTPTPSPGAATETLTFRVITPDGSMATKAQVLAVESVMDARLRAYGLGNFSSSASDDRLTYEVSLEQGDATSVASVGDLLRPIGAFSVSSLGATPIEAGDRVQGRPLFTGDAVTVARLATSGSGTPTLELTLDAPAAAALADATRGHVGEYLAVALDGVAVAAPMINEEILDGGLQYGFAGDDPTAARLAAILQSGPLPLPVEQVAP